MYARVSPSQEEYILTTLKMRVYITIIAGDGTSDVGALKQAHIGVALLNGKCLQGERPRISLHYFIADTNIIFSFSCFMVRISVQAPTAT